jgi:hypothetical protein
MLNDVKTYTRFVVYEVPDIPQSGYANAANGMGALQKIFAGNKKKENVKLNSIPTLH